ncbi:hypothetical protein MKL11_17500, partial [Methylobacterium sp. J-077]|nr:hypothetical protein [Methylobacterium sp. J-077]
MRSVEQPGCGSASNEVGHYARPELLSLLHDDRPASFVHQPIRSQTDFRSLDHEQFSASDEPA